MSRNPCLEISEKLRLVTSREGRVSRNPEAGEAYRRLKVTSREGRVSRNSGAAVIFPLPPWSRPARGV